MMQQLGKKDKLGVVQYDSDVDELIKLARTTDGFKDRANVVVRSMKSGSCTNLSGGLFMGVKQQQDNRYYDWDEASNESRGLPAPPDAAAPAAPSPVPIEEDNNPKEEEEEEEESQGAISGMQAVFANIPNEAGQAHQNMMQQQQQQQQQGIFSRIANALTSRTAPPPATVPLRCTGKGSAAIPSPRFSSPAATQLYPGRQPPPAREVEVDAIRCVFLFTDGLANEGIADPARLVDVLKSLLDKTPRVRVYTFGYGADHSPTLLGQIADAGGGTYYYIASEDNIPTAFADALGGLLSVAAQNVVVGFEPAPGVRVCEVHTNFRTREDGEGRSVQVGDLFSEENKDILIDVEIPALDAPQDSFLVGTLKVTCQHTFRARPQTILCRAVRLFRPLH